VEGRSAEIVIIVKMIFQSKVSVVIPAHNEEENVEQVIRSILLQTYKNFEIILVDNASTDRTAEIAKKFPIRVVEEERKGTQWAREAGRKTAAGEIIANIDADCIADLNWLEAALRHFADEKVIVVTGPADYYDASGFFRYISLFVQQYIYSFINFILQRFNKGAVIIEGNVLFRSSVLEKIGGYNTKIIFWGDGADLARKITPLGSVVFDKNLIMKTSARRFKREGTLKIFSLYVYHFFKQVLKN
jgi:peptidoglycan-N-acetylglucosamine deacetylase